MINTVDKCLSFGIKKFGTSSKQFQPKYFLIDELIPPVKQDEYFTYLGRHFDSKMRHPKNKMLIYQHYVLSKLSWKLTIADIDITWVKQSLDIIVNQYVRIWLEIPIAFTLDIIQLSKRKFGICYVMSSTRFTQCQTVIRNNVRKSSNNDLVRIYYDSNCGTILQYNQFKSTKEVITQYQKNKEVLITTDLKTQSLEIKSIWQHGAYLQLFYLLRQ